jgi:hypothetical protein
MSNPKVVEYVDITIDNGQTSHSTPISTGLLSNGQYQLHGFEFPASMTSTAATLTGARSANGTYVTLREVGGASSYPLGVGSSVFVPVDPRVLATFPFIKLVLGTAESGAKTITAHLRRIE